VADLLLASQNPGKLAEMRQLVAGLPFHVVGPRDLGIMEAPEETGKTFHENAVLKARYYAGRSGLLTVADDFRFMVDVIPNFALYIMGAMARRIRGMGQVMK